MNKRARNRLIGVTVIVLAIIAALFAASSATGGSPAYYKTVSEVVKAQDKYVGTNLQIGGPVVTGSWDKKTHPMRFTISDDKNKSEKVEVVYNGAVPSTFGDGVVAIVTGTLGKNGVIEATELQTKCPEKEAKKSGSATVASTLKAMPSLKGVPGALVTVSGAVSAGSLQPAGSPVRFTIHDKGATDVIKVKFDAATPAGFADNVEVVVVGSVDSDGVLNATSVAIAK